MASEAITLYGIPNCDTVKKARAWLAERGVEVRFHDLRREGVPHEELARWASEVGWEVLLNRRGTTWRGLPEPERATASDLEGACLLMTRHPSLIKRPVVQWSEGLSVGFEPDRWAERLLAS